MKSPHTDTSPSRKTICTIITASAPQVCLPSNPRPTHPTPSWTSDPADVSSLPGSVPIPIPYSRSLILENDLHPADHHDYHYHHYYHHHHPFLFFLYLGLRRYSSAVVLKDPLYYMGWSESLSWNEKKILTENWCLGDALEPLITSGTAEVTEKCCEVSSWSSVHEKCRRSLSKNKWLSKNRYPPKFKTH